MLLLGIFAAFELHKYVRMSDDFAATAPYIGIGIGRSEQVNSLSAYSKLLRGLVKKTWHEEFSACHH